MTFSLIKNIIEDGKKGGLSLCLEECCYQFCMLEGIGAFIKQVIDAFKSQPSDVGRLGNEVLDKMIALNSTL